MKKENIKTIQREEDRWINIHDDDVMREMGLIRPFIQTPRSEDVWKKTSKERRILNSAKHSYKKKDMHFHIIPHKFIGVYGKLIVYLKKNKTFPKTTYSTNCWQSDISSILVTYVTNNKKSKVSKNLVAKYVWNGKTYYPGELPFWGK